MKNKKTIALVIIVLALLIGIGSCTAMNKNDESIADNNNGDVIDNTTEDISDSTTDEESNIPSEEEKNDTALNTDEKKEDDGTSKNEEEKKPSKSNKDEKPQTPNKDKEEKPVTPEKPQKPSTPEKPVKPGKPSNPTHEHKWEEVTHFVFHEEEGHNENVLIEEAWTEEVYDLVYMYNCNSTECDFITTDPDEMMEHAKKGSLEGSDRAEQLVREGKAYYDEKRGWFYYMDGTIVPTCGGWTSGYRKVLVDTINHPAKYEEQWVVDKEAYGEEVVDYYKCECGKTKK